MALKLSSVIEALDKATVKVRRVNKAIERITAPVRKTQHDQAKRIYGAKT